MLFRAGKDGAPSTWRSTVDIGERGRRKQSVRQFPARTRREAEKLHNARVTEAAEGKLKPRSRETVRDALDLFVQNRVLAKTTRHRYQELVRLQLIPLLGDIELDRLTVDDIETAYRKLAESGGA